MCIRNATIVVDADGNLKIVGGDRCPLFRLCHESNLRVHWLCRRILARFPDHVPAAAEFIVATGAMLMDTDEVEGRKYYRHVCEYCGKVFYDIREHKRYCNEECCTKASELRRKKVKKLAARVCPVCNREFEPEHNGQKYCSKTCGYVAQLAQMRETSRKYVGGGIKRKPKFAKCKWCGKEFLKARVRQRFCSDECQKYADLEHAKKMLKKGKKK